MYNIHRDIARMHYGPTNIQQSIQLIQTESQSCHRGLEQLAKLVLEHDTIEHRE